MIWLSWRLQRIEAVIIAAAVALAAASLVPLGLHMASVYSSTGVGGCLHHGGPGCGDIVNSFRSRFEHAGTIIPWLNFLPGLIGVLFAAPLILEFEQGTFRFSWTQGTARGRWLAARLAVMVASAMVATFALTELITWFRAPIDKVTGRMDPSVFDFQGIVPYAYTLFAVALLVAVGMFTRRAVVAGGVTLIAYFTARVSVQTWARKNYFAPVRKVWPIGSPSPPNLDRAWNIVSSPSNALGHPIPINNVIMLCGGPKRGALPCMRAHHIYNLAVYQPASRFWAMQGVEAAIFAGVAFALLALSAWWIRNRI